VRENCSFADYFLLCTADNERLADAIADDIALQTKKADGYIAKYEGTSKSGWVLLDMGDVIVHVFSPEQRENYKLEELWSKGSALVRIL
jgi:ribosome-associated protein